jgi:hypothetical protein
MSIWHAVPRVGLFLAGAGLIALGACSEPSDPAGPDAAGLSAAARGPVDPMSKVNPLPEELEATVGRFRAGVEANGYETLRGYWTLWDADDCKYPLQVMGFCYGNNPAAPYAMAVVPPWRDEYVDRSFHHLLMAAQRGMSPIYRIGGREALVVVAKLPPPGRYFGLGSNVFTREVEFNPNDEIYPKVENDPLLQNILFAASPVPARRMIIGSIGNSNNMVVVNEQSGSSFGQERAFVITPDSAMAEEMTEALLAAGIPTADHVFVEKVSPDLVRVGWGPGADDLITYMRYSMPDDSAQGRAWRQTLPLAVLRVRDPEGGAALEPYAIPDYHTKVANFDEASELTADLLALVDAVRASHGQPDADTLPFFSASRYLDLIGQHCLGHPDPNRGPMNCLGDSQDTDYQISQSYHIDEGQVIAVVGTLGTRTGNATYVSVSVNWFPALVGVLNISDPELDGSAAPFASALAHDPGLFYVHYVARDCTGFDPCIEVPTRAVPVGGMIKMIQRNYINPGSKSGPDPTKLVNPVGIVFERDAM